MLFRSRSNVIVVVPAEDARYGMVRVRAWGGLHPKQREHPDRGTRKARPLARGTVVRVEVDRLPRQTRTPRARWLWRAGPGEPNLDALWRAYVRRFDLEHTLRFCEQTLGWTTPRVRHPEQADRRLPWERPLASAKLTPARGRRAVAALLLAVGTPASAPKPCGRSPGRPQGSRSGRATRHPALKQAASPGSWRSPQARRPPEGGVRAPPAG